MSDEAEPTKFPIVEVHVVLDLDVARKLTVFLMYAQPEEEDIHDETHSFYASAEEAAAIMRLFKESDKAYFAEDEKVVYFIAKKPPCDVSE